MEAPFSLNDNFPISGFPTSWGYLLSKNYGFRESGFKFILILYRINPAINFLYVFGSLLAYETLHKEGEICTFRPISTSLN